MTDRSRPGFPAGSSPVRDVPQDVLAGPIIPTMLCLALPTTVVLVVRLASGGHLSRLAKRFDHHSIRVGQQDRVGRLVLDNRCFGFGGGESRLGDSRVDLDARIQTSS
jgi:hypothetical protein